MKRAERHQLLNIVSQIKAISDTASFFKIEKQDFELWKSEISEMNGANREEWLEMILDNVMDDLKQLSEKGRNGLNTQLTKQVMNHIEKMINDAQDMLNDKRDHYVMHHDEGTKKYTTIVNREAYLEFIIECAITQLENLSGEIYDETGIDCDQSWGNQGR